LNLHALTFLWAAQKLYNFLCSK